MITVSKLQHLKKLLKMEGVNSKGEAIKVIDCLITEAFTDEENKKVISICNEFVGSSTDYLTSETGLALPEEDRVELVKEINLVDNVIIPKLEA